ncbi:hypothetical protein D3C85_1301120 [compost metagenome]
MNNVVVTVRLNAVKFTLNSPSLTLIAMPVVVPTSALVGVPLNVPVSVSKLAHEGLLLMLNTNVSESSSGTVGVKV